MTATLSNMLPLGTIAHDFTLPNMMINEPLSLTRYVKDKTLYANVCMWSLPITGVDLTHAIEREQILMTLFFKAASNIQLPINQNKL